jgi:hypothetical protein
VRIERFEDRAPGRYTYYESVHITSSFPSAAGAYAGPNVGASPLLVVAALAAGAYAAVAAAFARAYHLTTYRERCGGVKRVCAHARACCGDVL